MSGLVATQAMTSHFDKGIIVDPDTALYEKRSRVPRWNQGHAFYRIVYEALNRLLPNFDENLRSIGAL